MERPSDTPRPEPVVRRRRVFFLPGFDPRGPVHYHRTYREEAERQSQTDRAAGGTSYTVSDSQPEGEDCVGWTVHCTAAGVDVHTRYSYLGWDSMSRALVPRGMRAWLGALLQFWSRHLALGGHAASWRLARRWAWTLMSLPIYLAGVLLVMLLAAGVTGWLAAAGGLVQPWPAALAVLAALATGWLGWRLALRWNLVWLTHALNGSYAWATGGLPALDERLRAYARHIANALRTPGEPPDDEVLVVGHCMGAMLGAVVIPQVAQHCADQPGSLARLKFLTLASPMANYALLRDDVQVAPALRQLAGLDIAWLDYTAPQDPLCYFLVDAMAAVGAAPGGRRVRFLMRSARFDKTVDPATLQRIRRDPLKLHFLYLLATRQPVENDFFALTAGPRALDARVADGPPTPPPVPT